MSKIITPTVGRKVWFRLNGINELEKPRSDAETAPVRSFPSVLDPTQPLDASVVYAWNDRMINLHVLDHCGNPFIATSVPLMQEGDTPPQFGFYAEWMPYQLGQAKKETADHQIEQEIQAKGLTAPRITPADIEASIANEYFFTADQGVEAADLERLYPGSLCMVTICVLIMHNGHRIVGVNTGPVSSVNFDADLGRQYARENAIEQIWPLLGYELRSKLAAGKEPAPSLQPIDTAPTDGTVFLGYRERDGRWGECYRVQRDDCEMWSFGGGSAAAKEFPDFKPTHWMPLPANSPA